MSPFKYSISLLLLTLSTLGSAIQAQELDVVLRGPVEEVCEGVLLASLVAE